MKDDSEENAFDLENLVIKPGTATDGAPRAVPPKAARPPKENFARITKRHCALLSNVERPAIAWPIFCYLMIYSLVKADNQPFPLPVDYLVKETLIGRRAQLRALHGLAKVGILKIGRDSRYDLPLITIPGTTKIKHAAT